MRLPAVSLMSFNPVQLQNYLPLTSGLRAKLLLSGLAANILLGGTALAAGGTPIEHVIILIMENRSFDNYFGTFPGANGIPAGVCLNLDMSDPSKGCVTPWHNPADLSVGAMHDGDAAQIDIDDGIGSAKMDGFAAAQVLTQVALCKQRPNSADCRAGTVNAFTQHDVMGYHTNAEIPNYWSYATHFILQDNMFPGARAWSTTSHVDLTSEWVASCANANDPSTCRTTSTVAIPVPGTRLPYVSLFQLLDTHSVTWKYYRADGLDPDCDDAEMTCEPDNQVKGPKSNIWNPPALFAYVQDQGARYLASHNPAAGQFWADVKGGTLPQVSWVLPNGLVSEHPFGNGITLGQEFVTSVVNEVMQSTYWANTAIFVVWDDWGGFYDHVVPPTLGFVDPLVNTQPVGGFVDGFGIRVPGLTISPWVKAGMVDHQLLDFASYATFIEDVFMNGARLDPVQMGFPDARPVVRDTLTVATYGDGSKVPIGKLMNEFDFTQAPLSPLILSTHIPGHIFAACRGGASDPSPSCTKTTVTLTWNPLIGPGIPGPFTYHITRDGTDLPQCQGTATTCTDVPGSGVHYYRAFSIDSHQVTSPQSAAAEADEP